MYNIIITIYKNARDNNSFKMKNIYVIYMYKCMYVSMKTHTYAYIYILIQKNHIELVYLLDISEEF